MPVFLIPFAVFFLCRAAQFAFRESIKRALAERHPDVLNRMRPSFFSGDTIYRFVRQGGDRALDDPELTRRVNHYKRLTYVAYSAWGLLALSIITGTCFDRLTLHGLAPPEPATAAAHPAGSHAATTHAATTLADAGIPSAFGAAFVCNLIYLILVWRLAERWNAQRLGPPATLGDATSVLGVILWSTPASDDATFQRLRLATRVMGLLTLAGTLTTFVVIGRLAFLTGR